MPTLIKSVSDLTTRAKMRTGFGESSFPIGVNLLLALYDAGVSKTSAILNFAAYSLMAIFRCAMILSLAAATSQGVVISAGDGTGNTTPPPDDPGFANIGNLNAGGAIYLGNRWVLSAAHVRVGPVTFGGDTFSFAPNQVFQLSNPTDIELDEEEQEAWTPQTDILLFRITEDPGLPSLRLSCGPATSGTEVTMIGRGRDRAADPIFWTVEEGPEDDDDVWTEVNSPVIADRIGFGTEATRSTRWGQSIISDTEILVDAGRWGSMIAFDTEFDPTSGVEDLAQAVTGDSGGGVFQKRDGFWELSGMIQSVDLVEGHPLLTRGAVFGDSTRMADIYAYLDEIRAIADFELIGDINLDGKIDQGDADFLVGGISDTGFNCHLDLNRDGEVSQLDLETLLGNAGSLLGDTNFDGAVDFIDFLTVADRFGDTADGWREGDFDGDGMIAFSDFLVLSDFFGQSFERQTSPAVVPEPSAASILLISLLLLSGAVRQHR